MFLESALIFHKKYHFGNKRKYKTTNMLKRRIFKSLNYFSKKVSVLRIPLNQSSSIIYRDMNCDFDFLKEIRNFGK